MWIDDKGNLFQISDSIYRINDSTTLSSLCNDDEYIYVGYIHECVLVCTVACTVLLEFVVLTIFAMNKFETTQNNVYRQ